MAMILEGCPNDCTAWPRCSFRADYCGGQEALAMKRLVAETVKATCDALAERVARIIPDPHEAHEVCEDCWAVREAVRRIRAFPEESR